MSKAASIKSSSPSIHFLGGGGGGVLAFWGGVLVYSFGGYLGSIIGILGIIVYSFGGYLGSGVFGYGVFGYRTFGGVFGYFGSSPGTLGVLG